MPKFQKHIFVCGNQRSCDHPRGCCDPAGTNSLRNRLKASLKEQNLGGLIRVNSAGCLDQCELGPAIVIYPAATWYGNVTIEDIPRLVEAIKKDEVVDDLVIPDTALNARNKS